MVKGGLGNKIKCCGVNLKTLKDAVKSGAYPDIGTALDKLDFEHPLGNEPREDVYQHRMKLINKDIDLALFRMARATMAWTWVEVYNFVFILMGPESRGMVLHERVRRPIPFALQSRVKEGELRFLRFKGDMVDERVSKTGNPIRSQLQILASKCRTRVSVLRDVLENLVRTCDDSEWTHCNFPFMCVDRKLSRQLRLLNKHNFLIHFPNGDQI